jgi:hypothetical protein
MDSGKPHYFWEWWYERDSETQSTLEQFTGLLDKNGKEIYEGDITENGIIEFRVGAFRVGSHPLEENSLDLGVIGNIHENPELLKVETKKAA